MNQEHFGFLYMPGLLYFSCLLYIYISPIKNNGVILHIHYCYMYSYRTCSLLFVDM